MNGEKFVAMVAHAKAILTPHASDLVNIEVRADKAPWHTSKLVRTDMEKLKVNLQLYESTSLSKNIIPELDAKIKAFSPFFKYYSQMGSSPILSAILAAQKLNTTVNEHGVTASELFTGRNPYRPNEPSPTSEEYLEKIAKKRKEKRQTLERARMRQEQKAERKMIPYNDESLNSPLSRTDITWADLKEMDLIKLNIDEDKNDSSINLYEITKVDFKNQLVQAVKADGRYPNPVRTIKFARIARHLPTKNGQINMVQSYLQDNCDNTLQKSTKGIIYGGPMVKGYIGNIGWEPEFRGLIEVDSEKYPELPGLNETECVIWNETVRKEMDQFSRLTDIWNNDDIQNELTASFNDQFDSSTEIVTEEMLEQASKQYRSSRYWDRPNESTGILRSLIGTYLDSLANEDYEESSRILNSTNNWTKKEETKLEETKKEETKKEESVIDLSQERTQFWNETKIPDLGTPMKIEPENHEETPPITRRRGSTSTPTTAPTRLFEQAVENTIGQRINRPRRARNINKNAYKDGKNEKISK